jgi:cytochrome b561
LNTAEEYRFNNHGTIIGIERRLYDQNIHWAIAALVIQWVCWIPVMPFLMRLNQWKMSTHWQGGLLLLVGIGVWLLSEWSTVYR